MTFDVAKAVSDAKAGKLEYRTDRGANVHVAIGKKSFDERSLVENYAALVEEIVRAKPASAKGRYIKGITLTSTMGPGLHVDPSRTRGIVEELEEAVTRVGARRLPRPNVFQHCPSPKTAGSPDRGRSPAEVASSGERSRRCLPTRAEGDTSRQSFLARARLRAGSML